MFSTLSNLVGEKRQADLEEIQQELLSCSNALDSEMTVDDATNNASDQEENISSLVNCSYKKTATDGVTNGTINEEMDNEIDLDEVRSVNKDNNATPEENALEDTSDYVWAADDER